GGMEQLQRDQHRRCHHQAQPPQDPRHETVGRLNRGRYRIDRSHCRLPLPKRRQLSSLPTGGGTPKSAHMSVRFSLLPHRSIIAVGGPDRAEFLQGLISNDTAKVGPGRAIWAALLTPQGRFLNDMFVVEDAHGTFLVETERERAAALARKLKMYTLRSKVTVEDRSAGMEVAVVLGAEAEKVLPVAGATAFVDPRLPELGARVLAPAGQAAALLKLPEAPLAEYEALRLRLGVPDGSRDLIVE